MLPAPSSLFVVQLFLTLNVLAFAKQAVADELPPGLEQAIQNPAIPTIIDATILRFNKEGHAEIKVNAVYKPMPRKSGDKVETPTKIRGYVSVSKVNLFTPLSVITDKGKTRFLFFLDDDLLYSTYDNRFEIRPDKNGKLYVNTGRAWKPLKEMIKLIPKKSAPKP